MSGDRSQVVYVLRLVALPNRDAVRELRLLLKRALRQCGFRCISVDQIQEKENIK
jgi:hypothetical protein